MLNVAVLGATGRMGRTIVPLLPASADLRLSGALAAAEATRASAGTPATSPARARWPSPITGDPARALARRATSRSTSRCPRRRCQRRGLPGARRAAGDRHDRPRRAAAGGDSAAPQSIAGGAGAQHEPRREPAVQARWARGAARSPPRTTSRSRGAPPPQGGRAVSGTALALGHAVAAAAARRWTRSPNTPATADRRRARAARSASASSAGGDIVGRPPGACSPAPGEQVEIAPPAPGPSGFARGASPRRAGSSAGRRGCTRWWTCSGCSARLQLTLPATRTRVSHGAPADSGSRKLLLLSP